MPQISEAELCTALNRVGISCRDHTGEVLTIAQMLQMLQDHVEQTGGTSPRDHVDVNYLGFEQMILSHLDNARSADVDDAQHLLAQLLVLEYALGFIQAAQRYIPQMTLFAKNRVTEQARNELISASKSSFLTDLYRGNFMHKALESEMNKAWWRDPDHRLSLDESGRYASQLMFLLDQSKNDEVAVELERELFRYGGQDLMSMSKDLKGAAAVDYVRTWAVEYISSSASFMGHFADMYGRIVVNVPTDIDVLKVIEAAPFLWENAIILEALGKLSKGDFKRQCCLKARRRRQEQYIRLRLKEAAAKRLECNKKPRFERSRARKKRLASCAELPTSEEDIILPADIRFEQKCTEVDEDCIKDMYLEYLSDRDKANKITKKRKQYEEQRMLEYDSKRDREIKTAEQHVLKALEYISDHPELVDMVDITTALRKELDLTDGVVKRLVDMLRPSLGF